MVLGGEAIGRRYWFYCFTLSLPNPHSPPSYPAFLNLIIWWSHSYNEASPWLGLVFLTMTVSRTWSKRLRHTSNNPRQRMTVRTSLVETSGQFRPSPQRSTRLSLQYEPFVLTTHFFLLQYDSLDTGRIHIEHGLGHYNQSYLCLVLY